MKKIGVVVKPDARAAHEVVRRLVQWSSGRGLAALLDKETADLVPDLAVAQTSRAELPAQVDVIVVLGGDGTLLSVARAVGDLGIPILGVNLGGLGFLTATTLDEMIPALEAFLAGRMTVEDRMMLSARLHREGGLAGSFLALNDVVIVKGAMSRIIDLSVSVDGQSAIDYRADGLIIATPTGSTAYALSANGPILQPDVPALALVPISPHTLSNRPIAVSDACTVEVTLKHGADARLQCDGQPQLDLVEGDRIAARRSPHVLQLVHPPGYDYYAMLREKLHWSETPDLRATRPAASPDRST
jgi:NAD+ kinase